MKYSAQLRVGLFYIFSSSEMKAKTHPLATLRIKQGKDGTMGDKLPSA
jgi:hypothetical protein